MSEKKDLFARDTDFSKLVRKARRKSLIRNILISIIVSSLLFTGLLWLGTFMMYRNIEREIDYDYATQSIMGANMESGGSLYNYTPFSASVINTSTKDLAGVPVPWQNHEKVFSIFGSSRMVQTEAGSGRGNIEDERTLIYFQGERVIEFYQPTEDYAFLPDDRQLLNEIDENKLVEMAFSFDAAYSIEEVQNSFADHMNWYWVDAHSAREQNEEAEPVYGNNAYGFPSTRDSVESANMFIQQINWLQEEQGNYQEEAKRIYETLTYNGQTDLDAENLRIIGVVVTGTPEELMQFSDVQMIRAAVLGVTTDKY